MMTDTAIRQDVRPGRREDAVACADILNGWIDDRDWMPRVHTADEVRDFYRDFVFEQRRVWVTGDPIHGFLAMDEDDDLVTALYVAKPGLGIGRGLLNVAKDGRDRLKLWTFVANRGARNFYTREGFREIRQTDGDNEEGLPDVLLRWERAGR
ncbi:GNAT family N-acetyltransferase [Rhodophyticola porphyridii]|nr:GNAT family N-acetyltransferase [Rhodophyticola porphyridii]